MDLASAEGVPRDIHQQREGQAGGTRTEVAPVQRCRMSNEIVANRERLGLINLSYGDGPGSVVPARRFVVICLYGCILLKPRKSRRALARAGRSLSGSERPREGPGGRLEFLSGIDQAKQLL